MRPWIALALSALVLHAPSAARAATGEIGLDAAGIRLGGDTEPAIRLRGGVNVFESLDFEAQVLRTLGSDGTLTSVMVGPSLRLPVDSCCGSEADDGPDWTFTALVGGGRAESHGLSDDGFAWQGGVGMRWKLDGGVNLRVEGGWQGLDLEESADGPFVATGIAWRIGD